MNTKLNKKQVANIESIFPGLKVIHYHPKQEARALKRDLIKELKGVRNDK